MSQNTQGLCANSPGARLLVLGNEAIARGAIEARVRVATGYPGTPSTEIVETLIAAAPRCGFNAFWAVNEKVALDIATGASFSGARALVVLKHVGLNVAADSLLQVNLVDIEGGLVVVSVDDPGGTSSNNEQDNRWYAKMAEIPALEPTNLDEAREMTRRAFEISESLKVPVLVRSVTRLAHMTSALTLGPFAGERPKPHFDSTKTWSPFPPLEQHRRLQEKLRRAAALLESAGFDAYEGTGRERLGVAAAGFAYNYAREVVERLGLQDRVALIKVTTVNPPPRALLSRLLSHVDRVLVVEDVSPYLEEGLLAEAGAMGRKIAVEGRRSGALPGAGETLPDLVLEAVAAMAGVPPKSKRRRTVAASPAVAPPRQISFCSGCSHRSTYYSLAQAFEKMGIEDPIVVGDIGCYTLGFYPPFEILQTMTSMGASMGTAAALARLNPERKVVAVIGDSTLYHAGIPGLVQIAHLRLPVTVLVMDNSVTGSTGQQPHPGSWQHRDGVTVVPIEDIARASGFPFVRVVGSFQLKRLPGVLAEALRQQGPALVVSRQACALEPSEIGRRSIVAAIDGMLCDGCLACVEEFGCPAFVPAPSGSGKIEVDGIQCNGCAACKLVCPEGAISFVRRQATT